MAASHPPSAVLSPAEVRQFVDQGHVLLRGAFPTEVAASCREVLWSMMEADSVRADDPASWPEKHWISESYTESSGPPWSEVFTPLFACACVCVCLCVHRLFSARKRK